MLIKISYIGTLPKVQSYRIPDYSGPGLVYTGFSVTYIQFNLSFNEDDYIL